MLKNWRTVALAGAIVMALACSVRADGPGAGQEVVIKGGMESNSMCVANATPGDKIWVVFAVDGSPEIAAKVKAVLDQYYPDKGLDGDAALKLHNAYDEQLKFFVDPASPAALPKLGSYDASSQPVALTGTLYDKDGKHFIKVTKLEHIRLNYPEKMLAADKPFVMPDKEPLVLSIAPNLSLNCIKIPAGKAMLGADFYIGRRYQEEYPRMVTLTKPFYMAEIPITQEMWDAVMGLTPDKSINPKLPVRDPLFPDVDKFCKILSQKTGRTVRLPSAAEWEYTARVGTSNPGFPRKYRDQNSGMPDNKSVLPVKSKKPNAWGLYDMESCWWEITSDKAMYPVRKDETDPHYPAGPGHEKRCTMGYPKEDSGWTISMREFNDETGLGYSSNKFRVLVEVDGAGH